MACMLCSEWLINQHRDSYASYIGHHHMLEFFAIAENESKARIKFNFIQVGILFKLHKRETLKCLIENVTTLWSTSRETKR